MTTYISFSKEKEYLCLKFCTHHLVCTQGGQAVLTKPTVLHQF